MDAEVKPAMYFAAGAPQDEIPSHEPPRKGLACRNLARPADSQPLGEQQRVSKSVIQSVSA